MDPTLRLELYQAYKHKQEQMKHQTQLVVSQTTEIKAAIA